MIKKLTIVAMIISGIEATLCHGAGHEPLLSSQEMQDLPTRVSPADVGPTGSTDRTDEAVGAALGEGIASPQDAEVIDPEAESVESLPSTPSARFDGRFSPELCEFFRNAIRRCESHEGDTAEEKARKQQEKCRLDNLNELIIKLLDQNCTSLNPENLRWNNTDQSLRHIIDRLAGVDRSLTRLHDIKPTLFDKLVYPCLGAAIPSAAILILMLTTTTTACDLSSLESAAKKISYTTSDTNLAVHNFYIETVDALTAAQKRAIAEQRLTEKLLHILQVPIAGNLTEILDILKRQRQSLYKNSALPTLTIADLVHYGNMSFFVNQSAPCNCRQPQAGIASNKGFLASTKKFTAPDAMQDPYALYTKTYADVGSGSDTAAIDGESDGAAPLILV